MKRIIANGLLVLLTVVFMAGVFEVLCRTVLNDGMQYHIEMWRYAVELKRVAEDPAIGHEHVPNAAAHLMGVDVEINSQGLRDDDTDAAAGESTRVMMLGDSIVFGWGVEKDKRMSEVIERNLTGQRFGLIETINTGVGNYNTSMEVAYFLRKGKQYDPDIVVLNYFINDAEPTPVYEKVSWIARHSYAYAVLGGAWDGLKRRLLGAADWRAYYNGLYAEDAAGWRQAQESIRRLAAYCQANDIRLILAVIPELRELRPYPFEDVTEKLRTLASSHGVEFVDLLPAVRDEKPQSLWVTEPDPHPNARAHGLMGRYLSEYISSAFGRLELEK